MELHAPAFRIKSSNMEKVFSKPAYIDALLQQMKTALSLLQAGLPKSFSNATQGNLGRRRLICLRRIVMDEI